ncbi:MAG: glycosyltransferase family 2 protein [Thermoplasmataceae archaeon]
MSQINAEKVDVLIRTFNSGDTIEQCLQSVRDKVPYRKILIADHYSTDGTQEIAMKYGANIFQEEVGLGKATKMLISIAETKYVLFVDSDIVVKNRDFVDDAIRRFQDPGTGAVVGCPVGHDFLYGIPLGLTLLPLDLARNLQMPDSIQGRETYYFETLLREQDLRIAHIRDSMIHINIYRKYPFWPEWQGAQIRATPTRHFSQLVEAIPVIYMMHLNSKSIKNYFYSPLFYIKLLKGYMNPSKWGKVDRRKIGEYVH